MAVVQTQPIVIRKSFVGLVLLYLFGAVAPGALGTAALYLRPMQPDFALLLFVMAVLAVVATCIQAFVYTESRMILTARELDVLNWTSVVSEQTGSLEWNQVQDVELRRNGVLALLFGIGTLIIHAANDERDLVFAMTPRAQHWHDYMVGLAEQASTNVREA